MKDKKAKSNGYTNGTTTLIAEGTEIVGEVRFHGNLEVEGQVSGNIVALDGDKSRVRILQSGKVRGEIDAPFVVVNGRVEGDLRVTQQLELATRAVVDGNVHYQLIEIEKGAQVNGNFIRDVAEKPQAMGAADADEDSARDAVEV